MVHTYYGLGPISTKDKVCLTDLKGFNQQLPNSVLRGTSVPQGVSSLVSTFLSLE